ncbi:MAG: DUF1275 family protein [Phycisphaerae bacterium]|jgi:uncharacterized membrane protein YoaK (UPF0700 family)|nr:DUF1275 family protein [Phycisphaerae bacterium]
MLLAQAHSFTQQARLAITLAWVAGYTNVLTILLCGHVTSHVSGTTSDFGRATIEGLRGSPGSWQLAGFALFLLGTFFFGALLSGVSTEVGRRRAWESIYVLPIGIEAVLLASFAVWYRLTGADTYVLTGLASVAMGLQNATITRISSGVVRTTHVTGVLTDLGLEVVQFIEWVFDRRGNVPPRSARAFIRSARSHPTPRRLALLLSILGSFALGAGLGTLAFDHIPGWAMAFPVAFLMWVILQDITTPIAEIEPSDLIGEAQGISLPESIAVFHLLRQRSGTRGRAAGAHRLPNLAAWAERLPPSTKVVILDLDQVTQLDDEAAGEIRAALLRFREDRRHLLLAGVSGEQYEQLRRHGTGDMLGPENACGDLEIAIARGLNLLEDIEAPRPLTTA